MSDRGAELILRASCATRCGSRSHNEDNLRFCGQIPVTEPLGPLSAETSLWMDRTHVFCVCDGIGGSARGELASRQALLGLDRFLTRPDVRGLHMEEMAAAAAEAAHSEILERFRAMGVHGGCTMVLVILRGAQYTMLNIGDSPAFHYHAGSRRLKELSQAHCLGWQCAAEGKPCPPGQENRLVHYLGREGVMARDMMHITSGTLSDGDGILLCSDGVTNGITREKLKKYIKGRRTAAFLADQAAALPGADNCTAICLYVKRANGMK